MSFLKFENRIAGFTYPNAYMKNITVLVLAIVAVGVMAYAGIHGISRDHATGPFFIFLAACCATGLSMDLTRVVKEKIRNNRIRKFGR